MTVGTTVTRPAAATLVLAPSSNATADAASLSTGPAMGTMTAGTTAMRHTPTAPTRVGTWGQWGKERDFHMPVTQLSPPPSPHPPIYPPSSPLHVIACWESEITQTWLLSCRSSQSCGRGRLLTTYCHTLLRSQALQLDSLGFEL